MEDQFEKRNDTDAIKLDPEDLKGFGTDDTEQLLEGTSFHMKQSSAHVGPQIKFEGPVIFTDTPERTGRTGIEKGLLSTLQDLQQIKYQVNSGDSSQRTGTEAGPTAVNLADSNEETVSPQRKFLKLKFIRSSAINQQLNKRQTKIVLIIAITAAIFIPVIVTLAVGNNSTSEPDYTDTLSTNLRSTCNLTLLPRRKWQAAPSNCSPLLKRVHKYHLVKKVAINDTKTPKCTVENRCTQKVKGLQKSHQTLGYCDIGYNFLIAKGGLVYEGEGMSHQENFSAKDLILNIGLMGTFPEGRPADLEASAQCFIAVAKAQSFLDKACIITNYQN